MTAATRARLAAYGAVALIVVTIALRVLGFPRTVATIRHAARRVPARAGAHAGADTGADTDRVQAVVSGVTAAAILCPARTECLEQSLALYVVLRRSGVPAELRFGAIRDPFSAHAWVELHGQPVNEDPEQLRRYAVFSDAS